ncbi:uncharacterized protein TNCV_228861 [Trichonephila clavipes]|nr:uncharacterized protein TNCV_228861 [Trichonephila clavipes]
MVGSDVKRELEKKGLSFKNDEGERYTNKTYKRGPLIRSLPSSWSEQSRRIKRSKKEIIGNKRSRESGSSGTERKIRKGPIQRMNKRTPSSNDTNVLPKYSRKRRTQEKVAAGMSRYNLRPRGGREVESQPPMEKKTQQREPVRSRKSRGRNDNPYIEKRTRSDNWNARRRGDQQQEDQERKGASTS